MALADRCAVRARSFPRARAGFGGRARGRGAAVRSGLARARHGRERARARRDAVSLSLSHAPPRLGAPRVPGAPCGSGALWLGALRLPLPLSLLCPLRRCALASARIRSARRFPPRRPRPQPRCEKGENSSSSSEFAPNPSITDQNDKPTNARSGETARAKRARGQQTGSAKSRARACAFESPPRSLSRAPVGRSRAVSPRGPARSVGGPPAQPEPQTAPSDGLAPLHRSRPARMERAPRLLRSRTARLAQSLPPPPLPLRKRTGDASRRPQRQGRQLRRLLSI